jgi:iron complex transport system substrate-binding protein
MNHNLRNGCRGRLLHRILALLFCFGALSLWSQTQTVVDMAGRKVVLPLEPERVACISGPSYEKALLLGQGAKVFVKNAYSSANAWAAKVYPQDSILKLESPRSPNIEDLLEKKIQLVFFWDSLQSSIDKMTQAGIPVVVTQIGEKNPASIDEFLDFQKREVMLMGQCLGKEALEKAKAWCSYFDEKTSLVRKRTESLPPDRRPAVNVVGGPGPLGVFGRNSYPEWYVEMAGGSFPAKASATEMDANIDMETALLWNPDYIFMGRLDSTDSVLKDKAWAAVKAVRDGHVYLSPDGVMFWDYGSEGVLLMEYIATKIHPELFADIDMKAEVRRYYSSFYGLKLSDEEVERILAHRAPRADGN